MMAERSVRFGHVQMHQNHETHKPGYLKKTRVFCSRPKKSRQQVHRVVCYFSILVFSGRSGGKYLSADRFSMSTDRFSMSTDTNFHYY